MTFTNVVVTERDVLPEFEGIGDRSSERNERFKPLSIRVP
jgi:hypothetical protein